MDKKAVAHINNMSFSELKTELQNCYNNPIKEKIIRELMVLRYKQHTQAQQQRKVKQVHKQQQKQIKLQQQQQSQQQIPKPDFELKDDFDVDTFSLDEDDDYNFNFNTNDFIEYKKDTTNNNLMDRMNSDMEIKKMKVSTDKRDIMKPFVNSVCDNYATFKNEPGTDIKNFRKQ